MRRYWFTLSALVTTLLLASCMKFEMYTSAIKVGDQTSTPAAASVVAHWQFENDWMDSVGTSHGTPVSPTTPTFFTAPNRLLGAFAADLSSADARVDLGTSSTLTPANLTVSFWVKPTAPWAGTNIILWTKPCSWNDPDGYYIGLEGPGKAITLIVSGGNFIYLNDDPANLFTVGSWTHVAITFDSTTHEGHIYVNGIDQPVSLNGSPQTIQPAIGNSKFIGSCAAGSKIDWPMDELTIYNGVLTPTQVTALYQAQKTAAGI
jgi:Concanavalin A-like lectin/glucanases superfamily